VALKLLRSFFVRIVELPEGTAPDTTDEPSLRLLLDLKR